MILCDEPSKGLTVKGASTSETFQYMAFFSGSDEQMSKVVSDEQIEQLVWFGVVRTR